MGTSSPGARPFGENARGLRELAGRYRQFFEEHPSARLGDVCHTANAGRKHFACRQAFISDSPESVSRELAAYCARENLSGAIVHTKPPRVAFLFPGQGAPHLNMGRQLFETQPTFRKAIQTCEELLGPYMDQPLLSFLYPSSGGPPPLGETAFSQVALFALEYAVSELWRSWGIEPSAVMGYGAGEYAAACVAGVFSLEDGLALVAQRSRLMDALPRNGEAAVVLADQNRVREIISRSASDVDIAAVNTPSQVVISGLRNGVTAAIEDLARQGIQARALKSHAFDSFLADPILESFEKAADRVFFTEPQIPLISNINGGFFKSGEVPGAEYWRRHIRQPVRFAAGMQALGQKGFDFFLEAGPGQMLLELGSQCLPEERRRWLPSLVRGRNEWRQMLESLGNLYTAGAAIDWEGFDRDYPGSRVVVPNYPFQRKRYWAIDGQAEGREGDLHPILQKRQRSPLIKETIFESKIGVGSLPFLQDHCVHGMVVFPASAIMEMAHAAAEIHLGESGHELREVSFHQALIVPEDGFLNLQLLLAPMDSGDIEFRIISFDSGPGADTGSYTLHSDGKIIRPNVSEGLRPEPVSREVLRQRCTEQFPPSRFYEQMRTAGLEFGSSFRNIEILWRGDGEALGRIAPVGEQALEIERYRFHPALLDACLQVFAAAWPRAGQPKTYMPIHIESFKIFSPPVFPVWSDAVLRPAGVGTAEVLRADLRLFDDLGQVVAVVQGIAVRRSDAEALRAIAHKEPEDLIYEVKWLPPAGAPQAGAVGPAGLSASPMQIAGRLQQKAGDLAAHNHLEMYRELFPKMDSLCSAYIIRAFRELGWKPAPGEAFSSDVMAEQLGIAKQHRLLFRRFLEMLAEDGLH